MARQLRIILHSQHWQQHLQDVDDAEVEEDIFGWPAVIRHCNTRVPHPQRQLVLLARRHHAL